ncbi:MAG: ATP-binding cassette domain-containing protein [Geminicoccaceae bacterium]|nr:ATP-binding cassette domain-containing protein [Geminicoccaceae bacterium]
MQETIATSPIIEVGGLKKRLGSVEAVRGLDFRIEAGSCVGLLGPNGAGKTTTMRMLMGLSEPTEGFARLFGREARRLTRAERGRIGLVPQETNLDPDLTVEENLEAYGRYFGLDKGVVRERVPELLRFMDLAAKAKARVNQLSGGMKRRLTVARALIGDPDLVILDEPTTGLDPQARALIWRQLHALKRAGRTLLLTTHYMDEAERLCDRIVLIDQGLVLAEDTPKGLIARHARGYAVEVEKPLPNGASLDGLEAEDLGSSLLLFTDEPERVLASLGPDAAVHSRPANLEDVFLRLTGRKLRE